jgi:transposase
VVATSVQALLVEAQAENARLLEQLGAALAQIAALQAEVATANARTVELTTQIAKLTELVATGNERIAELLAIAQRKKSRPQNPAPKPPAAPPHLDDTKRASYEARPLPPEPPPSVEKPKKERRPTGRKPLPDHLPADETTVWPERCECGCTRFEWIDEVVEEKLDVRAHKRRRVTHRKTGRCTECRCRTTAEAPPSPFERSKLTCESLAYLTVQRFQLLVPIDRLSRYFGAQGLALAKSFLVTQTEAAADLLAPIDGEHWKQLMAGGFVATDGTGLDVQVRGVGLHRGFLEVYHCDDVVVFQYEPEKGGETQAAKLAGFAGTLLVDAESRYNEARRRNPKIVEANCNAHPRRKLEDAEAVQPVLAAEGGRWVSALFDAEREARERGLVGEALHAWRQEHHRPIMQQFHQWMDAVEPTLPPGDSVAKIIRYYRNHWVELTRFLDDPRIPLDNSASEREFQPVAKYRLNSLFAGATEGAHRAAVLLGIIATCRRLGIDAEAYLTWVFVRRGTHRQKYDLPVSQLTPAAYKRAALASS